MNTSDEKQSNGTNMVLGAGAILNEEILPDDYPVYGNYLYVVDGKIKICDLMEGTVREYKNFLRRYDKIEAKEIRSCDIVGRKKLLEAQS